MTSRSSIRRAAAGAAFLFGGLGASPVAAQGPAAAWRTIETEHFRLHFPAETEAWSTRIATRLEAVHRRVGDEVGYRPTDRVDILVMDPVAQANGLAWPVLRRPRIVLYPTPPPPDSALAHFRDWSTVLLVHEQAHLAHLLRPSRNPRARLLAALVPVGPIPRRAPRWLIEGYATLVEGDVTGVGRPYGDLRDAILRRFAQAGALPSYAALSGSRAWLGRSMAYLVGSAYLAWLRDRAGPDALRDLWRRSSAHQVRSFSEAFRGVFGATPERLYGRFCAELTYQAMQAEHLRAAELREGDPWLGRGWDTGAPAVSRDGSLMAVALRDRERPARLAIFETAENPDAEARWARDDAETAARDPEDVPPVRTGPSPRRMRHVLRGDLDPRSPRWLDDETLLFVRFVDDGHGQRRPDLFRWHTSADGRVERLTHQADLRNPDPSPDGAWAVAVRLRHGLSSLVRVELTGADAGRVEDLTEPDVTVVHAHPRIGPGGRRLAWVEHRDGRWRLLVGDIDARAHKAMVLPDDAAASHPAWGADGRLFATVASAGRVDLWSFEPESGHGAPVVVARAAAFAPAPTPDGTGLYFLAFEPWGLDVRHISLAEPRPRLPLVTPPTPPTPRILDRSPPPAIVPVETEPVGPSAPYGVGRVEWVPLLGGRWTGHDRAAEVGLRLGDVLGRFELLAQVEIGSGDQVEGVLTGAWRGPMGLGPGWSIEGTIADLDDLGGALRGLEVGLRRERTGRRHRLDFYGGVWLGARRSSMLGAREVEQTAGLLRLGYRGVRTWGGLRGGLGISLGTELGESDGTDWRRGRLALDLDLEHGGRRLALSGSVARAVDAGHPSEGLRIGGLHRAVEPRLLRAGRIEVPALADGGFITDRYHGWRAALQPTSWPVTVFFERHRPSPDAGPLRLWGLEARWSRARMPLLRLPAFTLWAGVAEILDRPHEGDIEGWLTLRWRP